jgi:hypothetical protein
MIELTPHEQADLEDAIWKAAQGIRLAREVLAGISDRLGLKWQINDPNHIRNMAGFIADNVKNRSDSESVAEHFANERFWK